MSNIAIHVENLSKQYRIGSRQASYRTFRGALLNSIVAPVRWIRGERKAFETFWALNDISFEVNQGDAVGIIGRNGAGKSTLLKVLSRITKPTKGRVDLYGRVASLLEVGTGFHPELSGRDNIYLNGAILGMSRSEINRKFDEIVDFAEVEKFLDTPVKHYSSGMYMRLAFAVAANLEPELLLVDEVLAVGDAEFQKKCIGKMSGIVNEGRTVLFVSHNMGAINNLCSKSIWIDKGKIKFIGESQETIKEYLNAPNEIRSGEILLEKKSTDGYFSRVAIINSEGNASQDIAVLEKFRIRFEYSLQRTIKGLEVAFILYDKNGSKIFYSGTSKRKSSNWGVQAAGKYIAEVEIPAVFLAPGSYTITAVLHQPNIAFVDKLDNILGVTIIESGSDDYKYLNRDLGVILVDFEWNLASKS